MLSLTVDSRTHWMILTTCKPICRSWLATGRRRQRQPRCPAAKNGSGIFQHNSYCADHPIPTGESIGSCPGFNSAPFYS